MRNKSTTGSPTTTTSTIQDSYNQTDYKVSTDSGNTLNVTGTSGSAITLDLSRKFDYSQSGTSGTAGNAALTPTIPLASGGNAIGASLMSTLNNNPLLLVGLGVLALVGIALIRRK
jgi:hypothetical protein